ncbi:hypothetical protein ACOZ4L_05660 [Haloplanus ruber]|uniref:Cytochrome C n=1 Tax=Haloplanus ruber TaxID=869892 RepID=A0ABD6CXV9_9EURY|nr:hypothetical protein [Haloplanus ruber]
MTGSELLDLARMMATDCEECHADHTGHDHDVDVDDQEDVREAVVDGTASTPVGTSEETDEAAAVIEADEQRDLDGDRANDQARFAGEDRSDTDPETASEPERNPGGLAADKREDTSTETETTQARPDAFRVPEGGQRTL